MVIRDLRTRVRDVHHRATAMIMSACDKTRAVSFQRVRAIMRFQLTDRHEKKTLKPV